MNTPRSPRQPTDAEIEQGLIESRRLEDPPQHVLQRAMDVWRPRPAKAPSLLKRVVAALVFDQDGAAALAFGARTFGSAVRQLVFSADGRDVDLRISSADDARATQWQFAGQVLGPESMGTAVLADAGGQIVGEATLSELGEFRLPAVGAGTYVVTLRLVDMEIALPAVQVPQGA